MSFTWLILKNLFRQRARTVLTVLGISLGIMTVVALGVITGELSTMAGDLSHAGGAVFIVGQKGSADFTFSTVSDADLATLQARTDVDDAIGMLVTIRRVESNPFFVTLGVDPGQLGGVELEMLDGRRLDPSATDEVLLGNAAAADLGLGVGDSFTLEDHEFTIVGIFHSGILWQDKGAIAPLALLQETTGRTGMVTFVMVRVARGEDIATVAADIEATQPNVVTVANASEFGEIDQGLEMMDAANVAISFLAVGIGAIGVMNTMGWRCSNARARSASSEPLDGVAIGSCG